MVRASETICVDAPVEEAFAYMDRPENQPEITPSLTRSETVAELPNGGKRVAYTYRMAGITLEGHIEAAEYEPEELIRWEMSGDLEGEIEWRFEPHDGGTRVTYRADYGLPVPAVERLARPFLERYNERELRTTLENLATRLEARDGGE